MQQQASPCKQQSEQQCQRTVLDLAPDHYPPDGTPVSHQPDKEQRDTNDQFGEEPAPADTEKRIRFAKFGHRAVQVVISIDHTGLKREIEFPMHNTAFGSIPRYGVFSFQCSVFRDNQSLLRLARTLGAKHMPKRKFIIFSNQVRITLNRYRVSAMDFSQEELFDAVDRLVGGLLERAGVTKPPVDALRVAEDHLGIPVDIANPIEEDDRGRPRPRSRRGWELRSLPT